MGRRGVTLVELIGVLAVLGVLFGVLLPAFGESRREARRTPEIGRLRQIGQAAAIYGDGIGLEVPSRALVGSGLTPANLFSSPLDPFPVGLANVKRTEDEMDAMRPAPYRDSVLCVRDVNGKAFFDRLRESPGFGWAVLFVGEPRTPPGDDPAVMMSMMLGPSFRLLPDGAVIRRAPRLTPTGGVSSASLFADADFPEFRP